MARLGTEAGIATVVTSERRTGSTLLFRSGLGTLCTLWAGSPRTEPSNTVVGTPATVAILHLDLVR